MSFNETPFTFEIAGKNSLGILHDADGKTGVVIVVGGPQYRIGSHRQFVQLSRALAHQGIPSIRFDVRGMGDSEGDKQTFDNLDDDIHAAINSFFNASNITNVIIWGLCDAASAALMYAHKDKRVVGLYLLNPWLENSAAKGKAMLRYYYLQRLFNPEFWKKLLRGHVNLKNSVSEAGQFAKSSVASQHSDKTGYQQLMLEGARAFDGKIAITLSGNDLTAKEFEQAAQANKQWKKWLKTKAQVFRINEADHTFSTSEWKKMIESNTVKFVQSLTREN
ncbi:hydrolase 1, exosortase A system-associated [Neptunicella marina]|uniref:Hydrolase 1, exosortase A system-associated n=1 Tax=Neptunicella marina TaxID=2125989 RepID=A0A8J6IUC3_9ALTE|nr:hydrolase 1, exosortase A system-associated [Neptunicella marina]MBC3765776.1 hydrolase 1, exosortase A system-associated [Neptunicella marina]